VNRGGARAAHAAEAAVTALVPVALAIVASGALLAIVGRDPFEF
jgi:hypothetical protein